MKSNERNWIDDALGDPETQLEYEVERVCLETAERLGKAVRDTGLTQRWIAESLGIAESSLSRALSGAQNMTLRTAAAIAFAAGCRLHAELEPLSATESGTSCAPSISAGGRLVEGTCWDVGDSEAPSSPEDGELLAA
jgi:hypothetical protein